MVTGKINKNKMPLFDFSTTKTLPVPKSMFLFNNSPVSEPEHKEETKFDFGMKSLSSSLPNHVEFVRLTGNIIKPYQQDAVYDTKVIAFKPFIKIVAPNLHDNVLCDQIFMKSLSDEEQEACNWLVCSAMGPENSVPRFSFFGNVKSCINVLFIANRCPGEMMSEKMLTFNNLKSQIGIPNALDTLDMIEEYIERDKAFENHCKIMEFAHRYCLEYIAMNSDNPTFDLETEPRIEKYVKQLYKIRAITATKWNEEKAWKSPAAPLTKLYNHKSGDLVVIMNDKRVQCHKTVLASVSPVLEIHFTSGNWSSSDEYDTSHLKEIGLDPESFEFIIKYAYDCFSATDFPEEKVFDLIKVSHLHGVTRLIKASMDILKNSHASFFDVVELLGFHLGDESMDEVSNMLIDIGVENCELLFEKAEEGDLEKMPQEFIIKLFKAYVASNKKDHVKQFAKIPKLGPRIPFDLGGNKKK